VEGALTIQKLIYLMWRKKSLTREEFVRHYLDVHSLLGLRLVGHLDGYTINVADLDGERDGPDAVVEFWTSDSVLFQSADAFANPEEMALVMKDDASFIGTSLAWEVREQLHAGVYADGLPGERTPGVKRISLPVSGGGLETTTPGVLRRVDHPVSGAITTRRPSPAAYEATVIVMEWALDVGVFTPVEGPQFVMSEYCQRIPSRTLR
jgi:hypothetical protein